MALVDVMTQSWMTVKEPVPDFFAFSSSTGGPAKRPTSKAARSTVWKGSAAPISDLTYGL